MQHSLRLLGYAGLIPFVAIPFSVEFGSLALFEGTDFFNKYSAVILSFLGGVHWYDAIQRGKHKMQPYIAMLPSIIAWFSLILLPTGVAIIVLGLSFVFILLYDFAVLVTPAGYFNFRLRLTTLVVASHCAMLWLFYK